MLMPPRRSRRPGLARRGRLVRAAIALLVLLTTTTSATAQGTSRHFTDPMSHDDALSLTAPLRLSPAQIEHLDRRHEAYLAAFRTLRDGRIDAFLERSTHGWHMVTADREEIVESMREHAAIAAEIAQLDDAFFESLHGALTEPQAEWLPRVVARRERQRMETDPSNSSWEMPRLRSLDVTHYMDRLELTDAEREAIDPALAAYEQTITPLYQRIHARRLALPLEMYDQHRANRAEMEARITALQEQFDLTTEEGMAGFTAAMTEEVPNFTFGPGNLPAQTPIRDDIVRISRASRTLVEDLRTQLDPANAARLESAYARGAYGSLGIPRDPLRVRVERYHHMPSADETLLAAIDELYQSYVESRRSLVKRMIVAAEAQAFRHGNGGLFAYPTRLGNDPADKPAEIDRARDELRALDARTVEAFAALTGEEIPVAQSRTVTLGDGTTIELQDVGAGGVFFSGDEGEAVGAFDVVILDSDMAMGDAPEGDHDVGFISVEVIGEPLAMGGAGDEAVDGPDVVVAGAPGDASGMIAGAPRLQSWLPGPISEPSELAARLEANPTLGPVFDQVAMDYRATYDAMREAMIEPARSRLRAVSRPWMGAGDPTTQADVGLAYTETRSAMAAILENDEAFFETVKTLVESDADHAVVDRARLARRRHAHSTVGRSPFEFSPFGRGSQEGEIDVAAIVDDADLDEEDRAAASATLLSYDEDATALFVTRWHAELDAAERQARAMARATEKDASGNVSFAFNTQRSDDEREADAARRATEATLTALNRRTLEALSQQLGGSGFLTVREAYERAAFPSVHRDPKRLDATFEKALAIELAETQRERVALLQAEYRAEYRAITERLIERTRAFHADQGGTADGMIGPETFRTIEAFQRDIEKDRFERDNLNQRTRRRLVNALDAPSRAAIGLTD